MTNHVYNGILSELRLRDLAEITKLSKRNEKKFLTDRKQHDIIAKLFEINGNAKPIFDN